MALQGFDKAYYLGQKLADLQATESEWNTKTVDDLEATLQNVYGLTAEEHYMQFGWEEGLAPNQYFNAEEYKLAKAQQLFDANLYLTVEDALAAFEEAWPQDPYQHYLQYGAGESINPSNAFDASQYFADKLAALQAADPDTYADWTATDVQNAFLDAGLTAIEHFMLYGEDEGLTITPVPADEQVDPGVTTPTTGDTFALTTSVDSIAGTSGNDTITGIIDDTIGAVATTLTALDEIDGAGGTDTFKLNVINGAGVAAGTAVAALPSISVANVESAVIRSAVDLTADVSAWGLSSASVTQAAAINLTAADTTAVSVSGATGAIAVEGGSDITISDATTDTAIAVGATTVPAGAVTITDSDQGNGAIAVDGGTDVTVTTTSDDTGTVTVGDTTASNVAADMPTGAITITQNLEDDATAGMTGGAITVEGGTTVDVTVNANSVADSSADDNNLAIGAIGVTGYNNTTSVTVTQNDSVTAVSSDAVGGATESTSVKFGALKSGDSITISVNGDAVADAGELTFTAAKDLTAAEVASAFANLTALDTQAAGGPTDNGYFTGALSVYTSGAATDDTVVFTATTANAVVTDLDTALTNTSGNSTDATVTVDTQGAAVTTAADTSLNDVTFGAVTVADGGTDSIATVNLDGYGNSTVASDALSTLSLANGEGTMGVTTASTSLALSLNDVDGAVTLDANVASLNVTAATEASNAALTATGVTALTVDTAVALGWGTSTFGALETVDIDGAGAVTLPSLAAETALSSFDASGNTGGITTTINANSAVITGGITDYIFSAAADTVTLSAATIDTDVTLGAGDDSLTLAAGTGVPTGALAGGDGTDSISMTLATAAGLDGNTNFATAISGFERLVINDAPDMNGAAVTLDLEALGFSYVTTTGTLDSDPGTSVENLTLDNMADAGTVVLTAAQSGSSTVVTMDDATGTADTMNVITKVGAADVIAGTLAIAGVESINITATDTNVDEDSDGTEYESGDRDLSTLDLDATSATSVVIDGNASLTLDMTGNTAVTSIDASALTGNLTVTAYGTATVTGGAGDDVLTGNGSGDTLLGGAGDDTLTGASLTTLTGGDGDDTFVMNVPSNVNSYSTITDLNSGDVIDLADGASFVSSAITLGDTAVFQDYANATINQLVADGDDAAWFQFGGNTYLIQNGAGDAVADFINNEDAIIRITGAVDLSTASYNMTDGTLEIA